MRACACACACGVVVVVRDSRRTRNFFGAVLARRIPSCSLVFARHCKCALFKRQAHAARSMRWLLYNTRGARTHTHKQSNTDTTSARTCVQRQVAEVFKHLHVLVDCDCRVHLARLYREPVHHTPVEKNI